MHNLLRTFALGAVATLCVGAIEANAAEPDTAAFVVACTSDPIVTDESGIEEGGKVTPKAYCECIAGKIVENKLSQADVDMLAKMHGEELTDADAESYPTLEDLMVANEGYEDACRVSLGLPALEGYDVEEVPLEDNLVPEDDTPPAEDDGSPPE